MAVEYVEISGILQHSKGIINTYFNKPFWPGCGTLDIQCFLVHHCHWDIKKNIAMSHHI